MSINLEYLSKTEEYKQLKIARYRLVMPLLLLTVISYMTFILTIAFNLKSLGKSFGGSVISLGIIIGFGLILLIFLITFYYVFKANRSLEPLIIQIQVKAQENTHA